MAQREMENNAYANFWGDKKRIIACYGIFQSGQFNFTPAVFFSPNLSHI